MTIPAEPISSIVMARQRAEQELIAAKDALGESNRRLQLALDAGCLGTWNWDAATDQVMLGPRAAQVFGVPAGFFRYLTKPIKVDEFLDTLDVVLKFSGTQTARLSKEAKA